MCLTVADAGLTPQSLEELFHFPGKWSNCLLDVRGGT